MSEIIVRMEMPLNCWECKLRKPMGICPITVRYVLDDAGRDHRPDWCPIIGELPETHGQLVSASTVLFAADDSEGVAPPMPVTVDDYLELFDLPTIVPATERSET